jgi:hypothetical protein
MGRWRSKTENSSDEEPIIGRQAFAIVRSSAALFLKFCNATRNLQGIWRLNCWHRDC